MCASGCRRVTWRASFSTWWRRSIWRPFYASYRAVAHGRAVALCLCARGALVAGDRALLRGGCRFRVLAANRRPDHATLARFVERHAEALAGRFSEVLRLCAEAGLVKAGVIAIDGKIRSRSRPLPAARRIPSWNSATAREPTESPAGARSARGASRRGSATARSGSTSCRRLEGVAPGILTPVRGTGRRLTLGAASRPGVPGARRAHVPAAASLLSRGGRPHRGGRRWRDRLRVAALPAAARRARRFPGGRV